MDRREARETALNEITASPGAFQEAITDLLDTLTYALLPLRRITLPYAYQHNDKRRVALAAQSALMVLLNPTDTERTTFTEREKAIAELLLLEVEPQLREREDELTTSKADEDRELREDDMRMRAADMRAELRRVA